MVSGCWTQFIQRIIHEQLRVLNQLRQSEYLKAPRSSGTECLFIRHNRCRSQNFTCIH